MLKWFQAGLGFFLGELVMAAIIMGVMSAIVLIVKIIVDVIDYVKKKGGK